MSNWREFIKNSNSIFRFYVHEAPGFGDHIQIIRLLDLLQQSNTQVNVQIIFHDDAAIKLATLLNLLGQPIVSRPIKISPMVEVVSLSYFQKNYNKYTVCETAIGSYSPSNTAYYNIAKILKSTRFIGIPSDLGDNIGGRPCRITHTNGAEEILISRPHRGIPFPLESADQWLASHNAKSFRSKKMSHTYMLLKRIKQNPSHMPVSVYGLNRILMTEPGSTEWTLIKLIRAYRDLKDSLPAPVSLLLFNEIETSFNVLRRVMETGSSFPNHLLDPAATNRSAHALKMELLRSQFALLSVYDHDFNARLASLPADTMLMVYIGKTDYKTFEAFVDLSAMMISEGHSSQRLAENSGTPLLPCQSRDHTTLKRDASFYHDEYHLDRKKIDIVLSLCTPDKAVLSDEVRVMSVFHEALKDFILQALNEDTIVGKYFKLKNQEYHRADGALQCLLKAQGMPTRSIDFKAEDISTDELLRRTFEGREDQFQPLCKGLSVWLPGNDLDFACANEQQQKQWALNGRASQLFFSMHLKVQFNRSICSLFSLAEKENICDKVALYSSRSCSLFFPCHSGALGSSLRSHHHSSQLSRINHCSPFSLFVIPMAVLMLFKYRFSMGQNKLFLLFAASIVSLSFLKSSDCCDIESTLDELSMHTQHQGYGH